MNFKFPKNIFSNNIFKNVLYLVSLALAVSYIINEQSLALISLIAIACGVYLMNKSVVIALFISIIVTNLLLSMNYLNTYNVYEGLEGNTPGPPSGTPPSGNSPSGTPPSGTPPSGNSPSGNSPSGTPPSGNSPSGTPPSGNSPSVTPTGGTSTQDSSGNNPIQESYRNIMGGY